MAYISRLFDQRLISVSFLHHVLSDARKRYRAIIDYQLRIFHDPMVLPWYGYSFVADASVSCHQLLLLLVYFSCTLHKPAWCWQVAKDSCQLLNEVMLTIVKWSLKQQLFEYFRWLMLFWAEQIRRETKKDEGKRDKRKEEEWSSWSMAQGNSSFRQTRSRQQKQKPLRWT